MGFAENAFVLSVNPHESIWVNWGQYQIFGIHKADVLVRPVNSPASSTLSKVYSAGSMSALPEIASEANFRFTRHLGSIARGTS